MGERTTGTLPEDNRQTGALASDRQTGTLASDRQTDGCARCPKSSPGTR